MPKFVALLKIHESAPLRVLLFLSILLCTSSSIYADYCFRIWLKDKAESNVSLDNPSSFLSPKAIARRFKFSMKIDSTDLPVSAQYISTLSQMGGRYICQSRWANTVVMAADRKEIMDDYLNLHFVDSVHCVKTPQQPSRNRIKEMPYQSVAVHKTPSELTTYGSGWGQINMVNGNILHSNGYKGKNITVAVIDGGFDGALNNPFLDTSSVVGTYNFVHPGTTIFADYYHGSAVFSIMASNAPGRMIGTAPEAEYWLLNSEDAHSEYPIEEDYLASAVEYADSVGADIANISLGYNLFDDPTLNHTYANFLNTGCFTNIVMRNAADKGLLVVLAAGNDRASDWRKLSYPANSPDVISVGAVDLSFQPSYFTSEGWVNPHNTKPNISALGVSVSFVYPDGSLKQGNGTSFSSPIICGLMACMMQAFPEITPRLWIEKIELSASNYSDPHPLTGYGIPNFARLFTLLDPLAIEQVVDSNINPIRYISSQIKIVWDSSLENLSIRCQLFDASGRMLQSKTSLRDVNLIELQSGLYTLVVQTHSNSWSIKIAR